MYKYRSTILGLDHLGLHDSKINNSLQQVLPLLSAGHWPRSGIFAENVRGSGFKSRTNLHCTLEYYILVEYISS